MSVHEPPQFTPAQILAAGHRAEGEGRYDFARQFFQHLIDTCPATPEAGVAAQALDRLARAQAQTPAPVNGGWPPSAPLGQPPEPSHFQPHMQQGSFTEPGHGGHGGGAGLDGWPQPEPLPRGVAVTEREGARVVELPPRVRDYKTGRSLPCPGDDVAWRAPDHRGALHSAGRSAQSAHACSPAAGPPDGSGADVCRGIDGRRPRTAHAGPACAGRAGSCQRRPRSCGDLPGQGQSPARA